MPLPALPALPALPELPLPPGVRSRQVDNNNGLSVHLLEAGFETPGRPCVLLLHGFPELAYSWRKLMLPLAQASADWAGNQPFALQAWSASELAQLPSYYIMEQSAHCTIPE